MSKLKLEIKFKDFEILHAIRIDGIIIPNKYDVIKWQIYEGKPSCFSIAFITYNKKEEACEFESVGNRYLKYREEGLEEWIMAFMNLIEVQKSFDEDYQYPLDNEVKNNE